MNKIIYLFFTEGYLCVYIRLKIRLCTQDEALASTGMGAALKMAQQMGFIENKTTGQRSSGGGSVEELKAQRYSVEDKSREYEEDDRKRRRGDRGYGGGATSTFNEKKVR